MDESRSSVQSLLNTRNDESKTGGSAHSSSSSSSHHLRTTTGSSGKEYKTGPILSIDVPSFADDHEQPEMYATPMLKHRLYPSEDTEDLSSFSSSSASHVPPLTRCNFASYSVGHVLNDMTAACWFSYLLLFLERAEKLSGTQAGIVLFAGQIADALATPLVGIFSDRSKGIPWLGFGRRKLWNAGGVLMVILCFLGVFGYCFVCAFIKDREPTSVEKTVSFSIFAALFNVGWASVQVSHMAMVPELSHDDGERVMLNSARYAFTVLSNVAVFLGMYGILATHGDSGSTDGTPGGSAAGNPQIYQELAFIVLGVGGACSVIFLLGTKENLFIADSSSPKSNNDGNSSSSDGDYHNLSDQNTVVSTTTEEENTNNSIRNSSRISTLSSRISYPAYAYKRPDVMTWRDWLTLPAFYQVAGVYSLTRLATNVSQVYLPFYVTTTLVMNEAAIASTPLLLYLAQLIATIGMKRISTRLGRRNSFTLGALFVIAACILMLFLQPSSANGMYFAVIILGIGCAMVMVISVSLEADLVARNTESGAFVYGVCSFADKLFNGIAILVIQTIEGTVDKTNISTYNRYVNGCVPLGAVILSMLVVWTIHFPATTVESKVDELKQSRAFRAPQPSPVTRSRIMTVFKSLRNSNPANDQEQELVEQGNGAFSPSKSNRKRGKSELDALITRE